MSIPSILKNTLIAICLIGIVSSCKDRKDENLVTISGRFSNTKGETIYLEELGIKELTIIDSVKVNAAGEFTFSLSPQTTGFYVIKVSPVNFITLLPEKGENIIVKGDIMELAKTYSISNSPGSSLLWMLDSSKRSIYRQFDSLMVIWNANKETNESEIRTQLDSVSSQILRNQKKFLIDFMDSHPTSLANLIAIWQTIGQRPLFTLENDLALFEKVQLRLSSKYPEHPHAQDLTNRILEFKKLMAEKKLTEARLQAGNKIPDLKLPDMELKTRSISDFLGKNVLVYFWTLRSKKCRDDNQELNKLYLKYRAKGFEIYQVSLDNDREFWKINVRVDKLKHTQVLGNEQVRRMFNVEKLPRAFLVDTAGTIVIKDPDIEQIKIQLHTWYPSKAVKL